MKKAMGLGPLRVVGRGGVMLAESSYVMMFCSGKRWCCPLERLAVTSYTCKCNDADDGVTDEVDG